MPYNKGPDGNPFVDVNDPEFRAFTKALNFYLGILMPYEMVSSVDDAVILGQGIIRGYPDPDKKLHEVVDIPMEQFKSYICQYSPRELHALATMLRHQGVFGDGNISEIKDYIKQFRVYHVSGVKDTPEKPSGKEFHRVRREIVGNIGNVPIYFILGDLYGKSKIVKLLPGQYLKIPPFVHHCYYVKEGTGAIEAWANVNIEWENDKKNLLTFDTYYDPIFDFLSLLYRYYFALMAGKITFDSVKRLWESNKDVNNITEFAPYHETMLTALKRKFTTRKRLIVSEVSEIKTIYSAGA